MKALLGRDRDAERARRLLLALAPAAALWLITGSLARSEAPAYAAWTDAFFMAAVGASYAGGWGVAAALGPRRLMLLRAAATTLVAGALVAAAEATAALGLLDYGRVLSLATGEWSGPAVSFVADKDLGWSRPPRSRWTGRPRSDMAVALNLNIRAATPQSFTTDARGFRNMRDLARAEVALVGDSYVEGAYVSDDETAAVALAALTGSAVANLGRSGYGTLQQLEVLRRFALPLKPRAIFWFFFEGNDLYDDETFENAVAYLRAHGDYGEPQGRRRMEQLREVSFSVNAFRLLRRSLDAAVPVGALSFGWFRDAQGRREKVFFHRDAGSFGDFEAQRFAKAQAAFRAGASACRDSGVELVLVFIPTKLRVLGPYCEFPRGGPCRDWKGWDLDARFRGFCEAEGLRLLDLSGPMHAAAAAGRLLYAAEDTHWNASGHRFVAELLAEALGRRPRS
jgi:lysophospholipase L1-like esterase